MNKTIYEYKNNGLQNIRLYIGILDISLKRHFENNT